MSNVIVPAQFTLQDLLAALRQGAETDLSGYLTAEEWGERLGICNIKKMRGLIRQGLRSGLVNRAMTQREAIDGTQRWVPVYAFDLSKVEEKKEKAP